MIHLIKVYFGQKHSLKCFADINPSDSDEKVLDILISRGEMLQTMKQSVTHISRIDQKPLNN